MPTTEGLISRSLEVPGARLHYEVRGSGPLLLVVGSPMTAAEFAPLALAMARHRTVVTYDPRGFGRSPIDDPDSPSTPELRAVDVAAILDDLGAASADVFGSSGGAVTGLALVARFPGRVRMLVVHEPPLLELPPDAKVQRAATKDITDTFLADGLRGMDEVHAQRGLRPGRHRLRSCWATRVQPPVDPPDVRRRRGATRRAHHRVSRRSRWIHQYPGEFAQRLLGILAT